MKVALVSAVYPPEPIVSAQMGRDLAAHLADNGARVTVLCPPPSRPIGADYSALHPRGRPLVRTEDGVEVVRLPSFTAPGSRLLPRMWESLSFGRHACAYLKEHLADADVIYANTWPLLSQAVIARFASRRGIPLLLHIKDLYPESLLVKLPRTFRPLANRPLTMMDAWIARQACRVVVISERMRRSYLEVRGIAGEKVFTLCDWIDSARFEQLPDRAAACGRYGVREDRFTFLYLGNIGPVAGVELLIQAFDAAALPEAQLLIIGDGSAKAGCVALARRLQRRDVHFVSDPVAANVPLLQSLGHVCLLPVRKGAAMSSIPSKLMAYLLSAKPVLATVDAESDTAVAIRTANCGWVGAPEDQHWLAGKMKEIMALPQAELHSAGQNGRRFALRNYSKAGCLPKLTELVLGAAAQRSQANSSRQSDVALPH